MNQPPKITDRVLWIAVPREIRDDKGRLKNLSGSCECGAPAHANPYLEPNGTYTCPILRTPLPLSGLSKYPPPGQITEGWPVQTEGNAAYYLSKANLLGLQGVHIDRLAVSEQHRGIVDVTYCRAEHEDIEAWASRVALVEKSEAEHVKYELPRIARSAEYSVKSHDEAIERRSKQRAAAQARLDVYRKAHAYYTQGQAPEKTTAKEPSVAGVVYFTTFSQLNNGQKFKWNDPSQSYLSELGECIKLTDGHFKRADGKLSNTAVKTDTPVLVEVRPVTEEKEPPRHVSSKPFDQLAVGSTFIFDNPLRGRATACTKHDLESYRVGNDPTPRAMFDLKREVLILQEAEPRSPGHAMHAFLRKFMGAAYMNEVTRPEEPAQEPTPAPAQEPTPAPYHKAVTVRLDGGTTDHRVDALSYLAEGLVKVHNRDTLSKFAPDDTRRTFGDVSMGAFFYYCSPEFDYKVAPNATAWQRISHTEALPVAFIHRTDEDALKIAPTNFDQGDIVAGVKVSE